jgi:hypothetical protein
MDWKPAIESEDNNFKIPDRWLYLHYYEALNILFRFENSLRVFVYSILKNAHFDEWASKTFPTSDGQKSINNLASSRLSQANSFGYLGYDITCPIMHITSGELVDLITSDVYWPLFKKYFKGNKEIMKNKLLEIGSIRNSLAHFRPIKTDDVEVVKQNSKHTLIEVENCLKNLYFQYNKVPTNTHEDWYEKISNIGNEHITISLLYSGDEKWVKVQIMFKATQLSKRNFGTNNYSYKVTNIITPNIVKDFKILGKFVTYISENILYPNQTSDYDIVINKSINMVFSKSVLKAHCEEISEEIKQLAEKITEETDLIVDDNLARGEILNSVDCSGVWRKPADSDGKWVFLYSTMNCPSQPDHPTEYWGNIGYYGDDIVAGTNKYPWMPSDISKEEFPF